MHVSKGQGGNIKREISGVGARLAGLLKRRGISVSAFQEALHKKSVPGSGYSTVFGYLKGRVEPAPEFVRAAAAQLGIRYEWLTTGDGEETEAEQTVTKKEAIADPFGDYGILGDLVLMGWSSGARALFHDAWRRYVAGVRTDKEIPQVTVTVLGLMILKLVLLPSELWGFKHRLSEREEADFHIAMLRALMLAMPEAGRGDTLEEKGVIHLETYPCGKTHVTDEEEDDA